MRLNDMSLVDEDGTLKLHAELAPLATGIEATLVLTFGGTQQVRIATTSERMQTLLMISHMPILKVSPFTHHREGGTLNRVEAFRLLKGEPDG